MSWYKSVNLDLCRRPTGLLEEAGLVKEAVLSKAHHTESRVNFSFVVALNSFAQIFESNPAGEQLSDLHAPHKISTRDMRLRYVNAM